MGGIEDYLGRSTRPPPTTSAIWLVATTAFTWSRDEPMTEFQSCRPNLEVGDLAPAAAFLRDVLGFEVEVDEPEMGLMLLRRDAVGLALVRSATPGVNTTTAAYIGVTGVDDLHDRCAARGAPIVVGLADHPWGLRDFVVEMPGGHRLALGERIAPAQ
jgi:predicted enzyme related to lactoylglutathione lyase